MKLLGGGITPQEWFPHEDLTPDNAVILSLLLANRDIRLSTHTQADRYWLYANAHRVILGAAQRYLSDPDYVQVLSHGVTTYESISTLLRPQIQFEDMDLTQTGVVGIGARLTDLIEALQQAEAEFRTMQHTIEVVRETAEHDFPPSLGEYAVFGAAMAWQMECEAART